MDFAGIAVSVAVGFCLSLLAPVAHLSASDHQDKEVRAVRTEAPITIDGRLLEKQWLEAEPGTDFTCQQTGGEPGLDTEFRVLYDDDSIYFGFTCWDSQTDKLVANTTVRDGELWLDDGVELFIDTFNDGRSCYYFMVNLLETRLDGRAVDNGTSIEAAWDGNWRGVVWIGDDRWEAEFVIPFSDLKFRAAEEQTWGFNCIRTCPRLRETESWVFMPADIFRVSDYGKLTGLEGISRKRVLTITPYITEKYSSGFDEDRPDQFGLWTLSDNTIEHKGADLKYEVSSDLTMNLTVNPDFAQIEADEEQFDLDPDQDVYFPEKRLFFQEGFEQFQTPVRLLYTRSIGRILPDGTEVRIQGGGKLVGKLGGFDIFALDAQTEETKYTPASCDSGCDHLVEPSTNFAALRLKRDIFESSTIGFQFVNAEYGDDFVSTGLRRAFSLDGMLAISDKWLSIWQTAYSTNPEEDQEKLVHYVGFYRNTNNSHLTVDYRYVEPGFFVDTGWNARDDRIGPRSNGEYHLYLKNRVVERLSGELFTQYFWNERENLIDRHLYLGFTCEFANRFSIYFSPVDFGTKRYYFDSEFPDEPTFDFDNSQRAVTVGYNMEQWACTYVRYQWGDYYGAALDQLKFETRWQLIKDVSFTLSLENVRTAQQDEQSFFEGRSAEWIAVIRTYYQPTPDLYFRVFMQTRSGREDAELVWDNLLNTSRYDINFLFGYTFRPGSTFYLAYNKVEGKSGVPTDVVFMKLSYMFTL
jgi:hypothetical protein